MLYELKCDGCSMVGFCSEGCRSTGQAKHADVCAKMRHTTAVVQLLHEYGRGPGAVSTVCGPIATDSWASYLQEARVHLFGDSVQHAGPALRFAVQDSLSCPLVLLEGLRGAGRGDAVNKPQAAVELIGASGYEFDAFMKWEELLHRCPNLQDLTVRMVGPEALVLSDGPSMDVSGDLCETCRRHGKTLVFECPEQATRYEDWTAPSTPDARAAFNCGFAEPAADYSWPAALAAVAAKADGVPLVFTSLTPMDGARDLQVALRAKLRVLAKPAEAAFASPLSLPDLWERAEQDGTAPAFAFNAVVGAVAAP